MRNLNNEYQDKEDRLYAYDFDYIMHKYMMQSFQPWIKSGNALEWDVIKVSLLSF